MLTEIMISFSTRNFKSLDLTNVSIILTPHTKFLQLLIELINKSTGFNMEWGEFGDFPNHYLCCSGEKNGEQR